MKLSVIIPVYNEESTIRDVLTKVRAVTLDKEIIIVDDGSTDRTAEILKDEQQKDDITIVYNSLINIGKGAAVRIGIEQITGELAIIQDADLELDPNEYVKLIQPILAGEADVVYGSRFKEHWQGAFKQIVANTVLTWLTNLLYRTRLTDMETAYKVFRTEVLKSVKLRCIGFEFEPEITAKISRLGYHIVEIPIAYHPRTTEQGKKIRWWDGVLAIYYLVKYRCQPIDALTRKATSHAWRPGASESRGDSDCKK
ncbi:glycosyltransferase [candidate division KSB3 bacterium]|uniref:Glycosyltransferase n=1 Tax=candidate division KSB3 bacterium TaxID=2044937 RepID=A0A9D5Q6I2_9BACT|nr:glycosyltransferase [candidate division KSB3 bacterium]MBD3325874.1 glycosyltransferase [candidate division KSB3 bacterium]